MAVASRKTKKRRSRTRRTGTKPRSSAAQPQEVQDPGKGKSHALRKTVFGMVKARKKKSEEKLKVGQPGDAFEKEADALADRVVQGGDQAAASPAQVQKTSSSDLNCKECGTQMTPDPGGASVQASPDLLQRRKGAAPVPTEKFSRRMGSAKKGGKSLPGAVRKQMETSMGADFSGVRIHTDARSSELNRAIGAKAFTNQNHIFFNEGQFDPSGSRGRHLLAHELTHTLQQGAARTKSPASAGLSKARGKSMVQKADEDESPPQEATRPATITISCNQVAGKFALLNPYHTSSHTRDSARVYKVPLYEMTVSGTTADGSPLSMTFNVVRYGVCRRTKAQDSEAFICGLSSARTETPSWNSGGPAGGGFRIIKGKGFYIHPGAIKPEKTPVGASGCVEVTGGNWSTFEFLIQELTGAENNTDAATNLSVVVEACSPPSLEQVTE